MRKSLVAIVSILLIGGCAKKTEQQVEKVIFSASGREVLIYTTADTANLRLAQTGKKVFTEAKQPLESEVSVFVNPSIRFQTLMGIGGAITDASAETFAKLPEAQQKEFLKACYDPKEGIGYSLARTTIHSCDFSSGSYTYVSEGDKDLKTFSIAHDQQYKIPLIKKSIEAAGGKLVTYASPWSPPAYMKDNNNMLKGGKLLPEYYQTWATYYTKFIKAYEAENIPVWGITIQNEPMAVQTWESCIYTAEEERDFLKKYLGPTMKKEGLSEKKIVVWDHNRDLLSQRANTIFDDPEASKYAWGIGFHWYEPWSGGNPMYDNVYNVRESYPTKNLLFTEGCVDKFDTSGYQSWPNAEKFGHSMIHDFNNGTVGWTFWNVLLDEQGGPNHVGNYCFAPIHGDTKTGKLIYTPTYYYIGHFSKFIRPNAKRISSTSSKSHLITTSFLNEDGKIATIVMNQSADTITYKLYIGNNAIEETILPHSIQTLVY
jgi:glucosylceramidase